MAKKYKPSITYSEQYNRWEISSEQHEGHKYSVQYNFVTGRYICSCPWGRGRAIQSKKDCKHIKALQEYLTALHTKIMDGLK